MYAACDGSFVSERMATYFDRLARDMKPYRYLLEMDVEHRKQLQSARKREDVAVRALLTVAGRHGNVEYAARTKGERREDEDEAARIAREHCFDAARLIALAWPGQVTRPPTRGGAACRVAR